MSAKLAPAEVRQARHSARPIGRTFPLAEGAEALRFLASRRSTGKLLLLP